VLGGVRQDRDELEVVDEPELVVFEEPDPPVEPLVV
jgi:hypothetical protein